MSTNMVPIWRAALLCRCPRCGEGSLFKGLLAVRETCEHCGLDLRGHDTGDGPAALSAFIIGPIIIGLALWVEFRFGPPLWVHLLLWPIMTFLLTLGYLRPAKAAMIALQYRHRTSGMDV
jgi:uncharacterized protein (DUF983 family)